MKTLRERMNNKKGFTLAELLIVVAIIAIMIAISVPIFTSQLNKAKTATDQANERAAKSAAVSAYLTDEGKYTSYNYDAVKGTVSNSDVPASGYNKMDIKADSSTGQTKVDAGDGYIQVTVTPAASETGNPTVKVLWVE